MHTGGLWGRHPFCHGCPQPGTSTPCCRGPQWSARLPLQRAGRKVTRLKDKVNGKESRARRDQTRPVREHYVASRLSPTHTDTPSRQQRQTGEIATATGSYSQTGQLELEHTVEGALRSAHSPRGDRVRVFLLFRAIHLFPIGFQQEFLARASGKGSNSRL